MCFLITHNSFRPYTITSSILQIGPPCFTWLELKNIIYIVHLRVYIYSHVLCFAILVIALQCYLVPNWDLVHLSWAAFTFAHSTSRQAFESVFLQEHRCVLQSVLQLQRIISNNDWHASGRSVRIGRRRPLESLQPQSCGRSWFCFHSWTCKYTLRLWKLAAEDVGGRFSGCKHTLPVASFWQYLI